jgi:hypothetical protein
MSSPSDDDPDDPDDILRVIQAKIDRENVQTPSAVPTTDVFTAGDENESPSAHDPLSAASAEDWEATANRASRDTAASIRDTESFRRRRAVDALANSRVSLNELESMSTELGERNAAHARELEEVARLNGISLTEEGERHA